MKKTLTALTALLIGSALFAETGYDIIKKSHDVPDPKTSSSTFLIVSLRFFTILILAKNLTIFFGGNVFKIICGVYNINIL